MPAEDDRRPIVPAAGALLGLGAFLVYLRTAYRTVPFWDAGEFIATSFALGIPHQPSTPLYVLLGRLAALVPLGSVAFRVNLLSAAATALLVLFTFLAAVRLARRMGEGGTAVPLVAGLAAGGLAAFSSTIWSNALEAEVYALSGMVTALGIWAVVRWADRPPDERSARVLPLVFYLLSLSIAIHLGTYLVLPGLLVLVARERPPGLIDRRDLLLWLVGLPVASLLGARMAGAMGLGAASSASGFLGGALLLLLAARDRRLPLLLLALLLVGVSVHLFLPIRSALDPMINEGEPDNWSSFWDTLTRAQYPAANPLVRRAPFLFQLDHMFLRYVLAQWPIVPAAGWIGGLLALAAALLAALRQVRRDRSGFGLLLAVALLTGPFLVVYLNFTDHEVRERDYFFSLFFQTLALWAGLGLGLVAARAAGGRGGAPLVAAGALVLLLAWTPLKTGWFEHDRRDDTIARDYAYNMLVPLPPDAFIFTNGDNDTFPLWYLQEVEGIRKDVRVVNLSLLNTPWYIRQLRDYEPQVPITWTDLEVEEVARRGPILDRETRQVLWVKDLAVRRILADNQNRRPAYIAVTVPQKMGLEERLVMEGLSHRIEAAPTATRLDLELCRRNVYERFTPLSGILTPEGKTDTTLYRDPNEIKLIQNYAAIHFYMAVELERVGRVEEALREAERALQISPSFAGNQLFLGLLHERMGNPGEAEAHYRRSLAGLPGDARLLHRLGWVVASQGRRAEAVPILRQAIEVGGPTYFDPYASLFEVYVTGGQVERAVGVLDAWLAAHPGDDDVRAVRDRAARGELPPPGPPGEPRLD